MSTLEAALIVAVVVLVGLPVSFLQIRRAQRADAARDQILHASVLSTEGAREVDELELLYSLPAHNPVWDAGGERLWDAIRDEQQKGEQT